MSTVSFRRVVVFILIVCSMATATSSNSSSTGVFSDQRNKVVVKVGMIGDSQTGKTSLMVKYVEGRFDEDYIQTLGTVSITWS